MDNKDLLSYDGGKRKGVKELLEGILDFCCFRLVWILSCNFGMKRSLSHAHLDVCSIHDRLTERVTQASPGV